VTQVGGKRKRRELAEVGGRGNGSGLECPLTALRKALPQFSMDFLEFQKEPEELEKPAKVVSFGIFPLARTAYIHDYSLMRL